MPTSCLVQLVLSEILFLKFHVYELYFVVSVTFQERKFCNLGMRYSIYILQYVRRALDSNKSADASAQMQQMKVSV